VAAEVAFAGAGWVALLTEAYDDLPARPGATAVVEHTATGGPDGEVSWWTAFVDGRLVDAGAGHHPDPTVTMTSPYTLAARLATDAADPSAAFMQGRTKVGGDQAALLRVLALMATPEYRTASGVVAGRTRA
jgi:predicted lipid carrier protein YhbT